MAEQPMKAKEARAQLIVFRRKLGHTFTAIARDCRLSRSRVIMICYRELQRREDAQSPVLQTWFSAHKGDPVFIGELVMLHQSLNPPKVNVRHVHPPIPTDAYDFCATFEGYEPGDPIGYGPTPHAATEALNADELPAIAHLPLNKK